LHQWAEQVVKEKHSEEKEKNGKERKLIKEITKHKK
jgi:hypothetical protein